MTKPYLFATPEMANRRQPDGRSAGLIVSLPGIYPRLTPWRTNLFSSKNNADHGYVVTNIAFILRSNI